MMTDRMRVDKAKFGKFVASRREVIKGIETQFLLAKKLNVAPGTIGKIETGERLPSFDLFIDLADALQLTPGELMMVMAEREDGNSHFQEMNTWLFERVSEVLSAYQALLIPQDLTQKPLSFPNKPNQITEAIARADEKQKKRFPKKPPQETPVPEEQESN